MERKLLLEKIWKESQIEKIEWIFSNDLKEVLSESKNFIEWLKGYLRLNISDFYGYNLEIDKWVDYISKLIKDWFEWRYFFNPYVLDSLKIDNSLINPYVWKQIWDSSLLWLGVFPYNFDKFSEKGKIYWWIWGYYNWYANISKKSNDKHLAYILSKYFVLYSFALRNFFVRLGFLDRKYQVDWNKVIVLQNQIYGTENLFDFLEKFK